MISVSKSSFLGEQKRPLECTPLTGMEADRFQGCVATLVLIFVWGGATGTHTQAAEGDKRFILHCLQSQAGDKTGKDSLVNFILMT